MPTVKRKERPQTDWVKPVRETLAAWGWAPGSRPPDDVDGTVVGGVLLRRTPDGNLVGLVLPTEVKETDDDH